MQRKIKDGSYVVKYNKYGKPFPVRVGSKKVHSPPSIERSFRSKLIKHLKLGDLDSSFETGLIDHETWSANHQRRRQLKPSWKESEFSILVSGRRRGRKRLDPKSYDVGLAWLLGLSYINPTDLSAQLVRELTPYCGKISTNMWNLRRCPSRRVTQNLLGQIVKGEIRYANVMGDYITACKGDRLLSQLCLRKSEDNRRDLCVPREHAGNRYDLPRASSSEASDELAQGLSCCGDDSFESSPTL
jgi:hypothetical protein